MKNVNDKVSGRRLNKETVLVVLSFTKIWELKELNNILLIIGKREFVITVIIILLISDVRMLAILCNNLCLFRSQERMRKRLWHN